MTAASLPFPIERFLDRFASRRRWQRLVRAGGIALVLSIAWAMLWCLVDRFFGLPSFVRVIVLAINIAGAVVIVGQAIRRLFRPRDLARAAASVERRTPAFGQRLETVTSRATGPQRWRGSAQLLDVLSNDVAAEVSRSDPAALLPWAPVLRPWAVAAIALGLAYLLSLLAWLDLPRLARRYFTPLANVAEVTTTRFSVRPGNVGIAEGDALRVRALAVRLGEASPILHARSSGQEGQAWSQQVMSATADGSFEARVRNVDRDIEYFVSGGDASSDIFTARVWRKPAITRFRIRYNYPAYTALRPRETESSTGQIEAPAGTEITLSIETTEPLELAVMSIGAGEPVRFVPGPGHTASATFTLRHDALYMIRMASSHGVSGAFRGGAVRALPDRPPVVRFRVPPPTQVAASGVLPIAYQVIDDYGLGRLEMELSIHRGTGGVDRRSIPISHSGSRRERGQWVLDLKGIGALAGDTVELRLFAEDRASQSARSAPAKLNVTAGSSAPTSRPASTTQPMRSADNPGAATDPPGFAEPLRAYFEAIRRDDEE